MTWDNDDLVLLADEPLTLAVEERPLFFFGDEVPGSGAAPVPVVTLVSPPEGTPLHPTDAAVYDITCSQAFRLVAFSTRLGARLDASKQAREAAYDRDHPAGAWDSKYVGSSIAVITNGYRLTLRRSPGWPAGGLGILPRVVGISGGIAP